MANGSIELDLNLATKDGIGEGGLSREDFTALAPRV